MTIMLDLPPDAEARLRHRAIREGEDAQAVALRLLTERLAEEEPKEEPEDGGNLSAGRSMADLFAGRVGLVAGSGEAYSEDGGRRFAKALARKNAR